MIGWLRSLFAPLARSSSARGWGELRARHDLAKTTRDNERHWSAADGLSPDAALSSDVRHKMRTRARHEHANNGYAHGIGHSLANAIVGKGPRLQVRRRGESITREDANQIEAGFRAWARSIDLAQKLWTARVAQCESGEVFALMATNSRLPGFGVQLDIRLIEADQVQSPNFRQQFIVEDGERDNDGVVVDRFARPVRYHVLRHHPGAYPLIGARQDYDSVPAEDMIHVFRAERPAQTRGVPELASTMQLLPVLRRYTKATLAAAEIGASLTGVMETQQPIDLDGDGGNQEDVELAQAFDEFELRPGTVTTLPEGYKFSGHKSEQPTTVYPEFVREIVNQVARPVHMPRNVALANSSGYNFASGKLDHQAYGNFIDLDRERFERDALHRIWVAWLQEAALLPDVLPADYRGDGWVLLEDADRWVWPGYLPMEAKDAAASGTRIDNGTSSRTREAAMLGEDAEQLAEQRHDEETLEIEHLARRLERARDLGLPDSVVLDSLAVQPAAAAESGDDDE